MQAKGETEKGDRLLRTAFSHLYEPVILPVFLPRPKKTNQVLSFYYWVPKIYTTNYSHSHKIIANLKNY